MTHDELVELITVDEEDTGETLRNLHDLLGSLGSREPNVHEMAAFGAYIRDAYQGVENTLKRIAQFAVQRLRPPDSA